MQSDEALERPATKDDCKSIAADGAVNSPQVGALGAEITHRLPPLKALTSLRFFAAIHVVLYHLNLGGYFPNAPLFGNFIRSGYTGVSLFFILSGFILAYNYREISSPREFWISRFARIYPVYLFALIGSILLLLVLGPPVGGHGFCLILTIGLLQSWYEPYSGVFNGPGWTLSVEAFFYLVLPFLLSWVKRQSQRRFAIFCTLYFAILCVPLLLSQNGHTLAALTSARFLNWSTIPLVHLPVFLIGVFMGVTYVKKKRHNDHWFLLLGGLASLYLLILAPSAIHLQLRRGLLVFSYTALIYGLASVRRGLLTNRWMLLGGEISFSIYILQMPVMRIANGILRQHHLNAIIQPIIVICILIAVSYLSFRFIELPARIAIRNRLTHRPVPLTKL